MRGENRKYGKSQNENEQNDEAYFSLVRKSLNNKSLIAISLKSFFLLRKSIKSDRREGSLNETQSESFSIVKSSFRIENPKTVLTIIIFPCEKFFIQYARTIYS